MNIWNQAGKGSEIKENRKNIRGLNQPLNIKQTENARASPPLPSEPSLEELTVTAVEVEDNNQAKQTEDMLKEKFKIIKNKSQKFMMEINLAKWFYKSDNQYKYKRFTMLFTSPKNHLKKIKGMKDHEFKQCLIQIKK